MFTTRKLLINSRQDVPCAGVNQLLQWPGVADEASCFAAVEGLSCQTGLLDGPVGLLTTLLACGPSSDAGLAATQAGVLLLYCCTWGALLLPSLSKLHRLLLLWTHCTIHNLCGVHAALM